MQMLASAYFATAYVNGGPLTTVNYHSTSMSRFTKQLLPNSLKYVMFVGVEFSYTCSPLDDTGKV